MIVTNSAVALASTYASTQTSVMEERFFWRNEGAAAPPVSPTTSQPIEADGPKLINLSEAGSVLARHRMNQTLDLSQSIDSKSALNLKILQATLRGILGKDLNLGVAIKGSAEPVTLNMQAPTGGRAIAEGQTLVYERTQIYRETEAVNFAAKGVVNTADGRSIAFDVSLSMAREFTQITSSQANIFSSGNHTLIDPLVINFDGKGAELSLNKVHFDLDMDGTADQISQLKSGSGYLAWDKNRDGTINDGSELFGPTTGSGFAELALHDSDGNGFIDEADPIYSQLRVWVQHDDGTSQLFALGEKDVGAIFVGHASTPFSLKGGDNQSLGQLANSGVYLKDSGGVGLVQEIYLSK